MGMETLIIILRNVCMNTINSVRQLHGISINCVHILQLTCNALLHHLKKCYYTWGYYSMTTIQSLRKTAYRRDCSYHVPMYTTSTVHTYIWGKQFDVMTLVTKWQQWRTIHTVRAMSASDQQTHLVTSDSPHHPCSSSLRWTAVAENSIRYTMAQNHVTNRTIVYLGWMTLHTYQSRNRIEILQ